MSGYDLTGATPSPTTMYPGDECPEVIPAIRVLTANINTGQVGVPFSQEVFATGGVPPYSWSQFGVNWPAGITQDTATGTVSGTPTTPTPERNLTLKCEDSLLHTAWSNVAMTIDA